jgi:transposase
LREAGQVARPPVFDTEHYKQRNTVERCFSKLKQFRAVATRYDKRARIYQGTVDVASIIIWLRDPVQ